MATAKTTRSAPRSPRSATISCAGRSAGPRSVAATHFRCFRCYGREFTASTSSFLAENLGCRRFGNDNSGAPAVLSPFLAVLFVENSELEKPPPPQTFHALFDDPQGLAISRKWAFVNLITSYSAPLTLGLAAKDRALSTRCRAEITRRS